MHGGSGHDTLNGGSGADRLYGDAGHDGLFGGGPADDTLQGGDGADRFLTQSGDDIDDKKSEDAKIKFKDGDKSWTEQEIIAIDEALAVMHKKTRNTVLLEPRGTDSILYPNFTFERNGEKGNGAWADNNGTGRIRFFDATFGSSADIHSRSSTRLLTIGRPRDRTGMTSRR